MSPDCRLDRETEAHHPGVSFRSLDTCYDGMTLENVPQPKTLAVTVGMASLTWGGRSGRVHGGRGTRGLVCPCVWGQVGASSRGNVRKPSEVVAVPVAKLNIRSP